MPNYQNYVFVVDTLGQPLSPTHPAIARKLLKQGLAAVFRTYPFTIILKKTVENPGNEALRLKLDPGASVTGIALVNQSRDTVIWAAELTHRGDSCLLYTSPSPRDRTRSRMPSSA